MKLGPVTKLDKKNKTTSKNFDDDVMSGNCDAIVIFRIFGQFGAVQRPDSGQSLQELCFQYSHTIALSKGTFLDKKHYFC